ncbi:MAG: MFS transporter [Kiritimatiellia bacterium]|jgi:ACS family hexuronate transporter-like MFS transporter|nr:MFS transporter [Kiritimatiellia bacterium]
MPRTSIQTFLQTHRRWGIVALLFLTAMVNNLDRQTLSVLAPTLKAQLHFGPVEYSYVVTAFLAAYTLGYTFCGQVLDRIGVKIGIMAALAFWSFSGMAHAFAAGWLTLAVFRFLLGLGESFNSPGGVKALSEWIPRKERGLCMAIFSNGNILGAILAPPLVSFLAVTLGWQWAFLITGSAGFALLAAWARFYHAPESHPRLTEGERALILADRAAVSHAASAAEPRETPSMLGLLRHPLCLGFFFCRFLTDPITYFFAFWLPDYLQTGRHFTLAMIGLVGWLPFLASDVGGPGGGALSDWLIRRGWPSQKARLTLMGAAAVLMPLAALAVRTGSPWLALGLIAVLLGAQSCWMANQLTLISESIPHRQAATLLALSAIGGSLGGMASTLLAGRVIAAAGYVPVFTAIGFAHLSALLFLFAALRFHKREPEVRP